MRTWLIYVIALSTVTAECAQAPKQPEIAVLNSTAIFVRWEWTDNDVKPEDALFEVTATDAGAVAKNVSVAMKQFLVLDGLIPEKAYEIRAAFVGADQNRSPSDPALITLPKEDPMTPTVKIVSGARTDALSIPYTVSWEFNTAPSEEALTGFQVLYCSVSCDADDAKFEKKSSKSLNYYTDMTVTVLAVFETAGGARDQIASPPSTFRTVTGQPGPVNNLNLEQKPDTLEVNAHWLPPNRPNGEIVAYSVEVKAGDTSVISVNISDPNVREYTYTVATEDIAVKPHDIKIRAINNGDDDVKIGALEEKSFEILKPDPPTAVSVTSRKADSLGISIERKSDAELIFRILYNFHERKEVKDREVVLNDLEAFKDVPVDVFACLPLGNDLFCGKPNENLFKTNVGVPSQVRNLTVTGPSVNDTSAAVVMLNWIEPETPAGPIDGYVVKVMEKTGEVLDEDDIKEVLEYSYSLEKLKNCTQYDFAVLAYNLDLDSKTKINGTLSETRSYTTVNCDESKGGSSFPPWAIVLIVLLILGALGGGGFYYFKVRNA